jgi:hypothetical protein
VGQKQLLVAKILFVMTKFNKEKHKIYGDETYTLKRTHKSLLWAYTTVHDSTTFKIKSIFPYVDCGGRNNGFSMYVRYFTRLYEYFLAFYVAEHECA